MRLAIASADTVRLLTSPNPWVGAVLVARDGTVVQGATGEPGGAHAEIDALGKAGPLARGATMYVTLEPCSHQGRTGPCVDALIDAGVARVVVAIEDPDPRVGGRGIERLRTAGIEVTTAVGEAEVREQLRAYLTHRSLGRPYVVLKLAATMDGRIAAPDGSSKWITGDAARADAHRLRAESDAIVVGARTVRVDDPSLTVRDFRPAGEVPSRGIDPIRVVLGNVVGPARVQPARVCHGDLLEVLGDLAADGVLQVMVEGGANVAWRFHHAGLVDEYVLYLAPALFGGDDARGIFGGLGAGSMGELWRGRFHSVTRLGDDLRVVLRPR